MVKGQAEGETQVREKVRASPSLSWASTVNAVLPTPKVLLIVVSSANTHTHARTRARTTHTRTRTHTHTHTHTRAPIVNILSLT